MWSIEMKDFSFGMFDDETKTILKIGENIVAAEQMWIRNSERFILNNEKTIINERKDGNWKF